MNDTPSPAPATPWPPPTGESRPWTRWWWLGSAVSEAELTRHLELLQAAGFGGVELSPIYGVTGEEERSIPFLSPVWVDRLRYTLAEARRLGLGVDMITGTGWPLGGPWVGAEDGAARLALATYHLDGGSRLAEPLAPDEPGATLQTVMAYAEGGQVVDLTPHVDGQGRLDWTAPAGRWRLYAVCLTRTRQQVKRAAPGAEGNVVDHFSAPAMARYLARFDAAFADVPPGEHVRCFFNDSYEVYGANWTDDLFAQFQRRRGYDLRAYLPAFNGDDRPDTVSRVRSDYRQTVAEMLLENFVRPWTAWAHRYGALSRNQAHGSPGNLLDLYAAADIPEPETFGSDWLELAGIPPLPGTPRRHGGRAEILLGKLASSAAHLMGRPLCSNETFTWLGEHGQVPLAHMKAQVDLAWLMGVNHVFYHGTPFSPADADWPGWLFYATTHVAPTNPFWRDLPALNAYITRCQSFLQAGQPDTDLLLYFPVFDLWATDHGAPDRLHFLTPHNTADWLDQNLPDFKAAAARLWDAGYSFDLVSDRLLADVVQVADGRLQSRGGAYRALVVAGCERMPVETLARLLDLARQGATVLVVGALPGDVPGLGDLDARRERLRGLLAALDPLVGQGRILLGADLDELLRRAGIRRESVVDTGVELVRRRDDSGALYFLTNLGGQPLDGWVTLTAPSAAVTLCDPLSGRVGRARSQPSEGGTAVYLQLAPGESCLLRALMEPDETPDWRYQTPAGQPVPVGGPWQVEFIEGGPTLPPAQTVERLTSWTEWADEPALRAFSGAARYTTEFERPTTEAGGWAIDLGAVCHSACVRLNGHDLGTVFSAPFRLLLPEGVLEDRNRLEIEVTNLMANRLADLDRRGVAWQKFFFVNMGYQPFDASAWDPLPSGLLGPVCLVPLR